MTSDPVYEATCGAMAELVAHGITHVVASPGSRSAPLTVAARWNTSLETSMHLDERSAGFHALGLARVTSRPVVLICTSGTAAANYLPAVIEAHYTGVSLLVFTADRPPELREIGAGQTINQVNLFGGHVRHFAELAVAGEVDAKAHRLAVVRAIDAAVVPRPGPVHLNWPFREPLEPTAGRPNVAAATVLTIAQPAHSPADGSILDDLAREYPRGIIVAGPTPGSLDGADEVLAFSKRSGWPIIAEPISQLRRDSDFVLENADHLLKHASFADANPPDVVVRLGNSPTSKPLRLWLERTKPAHHLVIDPDERWNDATFLGGTVVRQTVLDLFSAQSETGLDRGATDWTNTWTSADARASEIISAELDSGPLLEAAVARLSYANTPDHGVFYVSNSMPVRDLDSFAVKRTVVPLTLGNRGASGIDGVVSSAAGAARTGRPVVLLIGDIATTSVDSSTPLGAILISPLLW